MPAAVRLTKRLAAALLAAALITGADVGSVVVGQSESARPSPSESTDPFVGSWLLNAEKSKTQAPPVQRQLRTFSTTRDGLMLITMMSVDQQGRASYSFWESRLDDTPALEHTNSPNTPVANIYMRRIGRNTIRMRVAYFDAVPPRPSALGVFSVSDDGQTLIYDVENTDLEGKKTHNVRVFDRFLTRD